MRLLSEIADDRALLKRPDCGSTMSPHDTTPMSTSERPSVARVRNVCDTGATPSPSRSIALGVLE